MNRHAAAYATLLLCVLTLFLGGAPPLVLPVRAIDYVDLIATDFGPVLDDDLYIYNVVSIKTLAALEGLEIIKGNLTIWSCDILESLEGLESLRYVERDVQIWGNHQLTSFDGLNCLTEIGDRLSVVDNDALVDVSALLSLTKIGGGLQLSGCAALPSFYGFNSVTEIGGGLVVEGNSNLLSPRYLIESLEYIQGYFHMISNPLMCCDAEELQSENDIFIGEQTTYTLLEDNEIDGTFIFCSCPEENRCTANPCVHGDCIQGDPGVYDCECSSGYFGRNCDDTVDDCATDPCLHGGTCHDEKGYYQCTCTGDWSGKNCEIGTVCNEYPCFNDGTCIANDADDAYTCECGVSYKGFWCEKNDFDCAVNPCQNNGTCTDVGVGAWTCDCPDGFYNCNTEDDCASTTECAETGNTDDGEPSSSNMAVVGIGAGSAAFVCCLGMAVAAIFVKRRQDEATLKARKELLGASAQELGDFDSSVMSSSESVYVDTSSISGSKEGVPLGKTFDFVGKPATFNSAAANYGRVVPTNRPSRIVKGDGDKQIPISFFTGKAEAGEAYAAYGDYKNVAALAVDAVLTVDAAKKEEDEDPEEASKALSLPFKTMEIGELIDELLKTKYMLKFSDVKLEKVLGEGAFGLVHLGVYKGQKVAVKTVKVGEGAGGTAEGYSTEQALEAAKREFVCEALISGAIPPNPHVVMMIGASVEPELSLVLEFCGGGSLQTLCYDRRNAYGISFVVSMMGQIADGLGHLHNQGIIHRDLATRNVLLDLQDTAKIADFGMSRVVQEDYMGVGTSAADVGPIRWMAPEAITKGTYSKRSDTWSFGVLCLEMFERQGPWLGVPAVQVGTMVSRGTAPKIPDSMPPVLSHIVASCFAFKPSSRPSMRELTGYLERVLQLSAPAKE